jgi:hypothetical protein
MPAVSPAQSLPLLPLRLALILRRRIFNSRSHSNSQQSRMCGAVIRQCPAGACRWYCDNMKKNVLMNLVKAAGPVIPRYVAGKMTCETLAWRRAKWTVRLFNGSTELMEHNLVRFKTRAQAASYNRLLSLTKALSRGFRNAGVRLVTKAEQS